MPSPIKSWWLVLQRPDDDFLAVFLIFRLRQVITSPGPLSITIFWKNDSHKISFWGFTSPLIYFHASCLNVIICNFLPQILLLFHLYGPSRIASVFTSFFIIISPPKETSKSFCISNPLVRVLVSFGLFLLAVFVIENFLKQGDLNLPLFQIKSVCSFLNNTL